MKKATKKAARATKSLPIKTVVPRKQVAKKSAALKKFHPATEPTPTTAVAVKKKLTPEEEIAKRELEVATRALEVTEEAEDIARVIMSLTTDDVNRERGAVLFRTEVIKVGLKQGHDLLDDIVSSAKLTYDTARAKRDKALEPFETADKTIRDALTIYYTKQRDRAALAQKKADEEQAQREREAIANREKERIALEEKIMDSIAELDENAPGYREKVAALESRLEPLNKPVEVVPAVRVSAPETTGAMSLQDNWSGRVTDVQAIVRQIVAGDLPWSLIEVRQPEANKLAKLYKNEKRFAGLVFENNPFTRGSGR